MKTEKRYLNLNDILASGVCRLVSKSLGVIVFCYDTSVNPYKNYVRDQQKIDKNNSDAADRWGIVDSLPDPDLAFELPSDVTGRLDYWDDGWGEFIEMFALSKGRVVKTLQKAYVVGDDPEIYFSN